MPNRPTDPPDFDWLHTSPGRGVPSEAVEETRVIPRSPRPGPAAPPPKPPARGPVVEPSGSRRRPRLKTVAVVVLLVLLAWAAFLVAVPTNDWKKVDKIDAFPTASRPAEQPGTTYLLVGSDSRKGLSRAESRKLGTNGVGDVGQRTDTIMLLHIGDGKPVLLSIPRDSLVAIPGHGTTKINAAFAYGGARLLVRTVEQNTGVRIDHFIEIGFGGFVNAVDAVHGVTICPTARMVDRRANLRIRRGCQEVDGVTALGYARSRHSDPRYGDITRAQHQREVVSAIGAKVKSPWSVLNPWRYSSLISAATTSLRVSNGTGVLDMAHFARAMTQVNGTSGLTCSMPIRDLAVHWDRPRALALLKFIKTDRTDDIPASLCLPKGLKVT
ncbi:MAG: LCP family protein [Marmoricola sp.]